MFGPSFNEILSKQVQSVYLSFFKGNQGKGLPVPFTVFVHVFECGTCSFITNPYLFSPHPSKFFWSAFGLQNFYLQHSICSHFSSFFSCTWPQSDPFKQISNNIDSTMINSAVVPAERGILFWYVVMTHAPSRCAVTAASLSRQWIRRPADGCAR